MTDPNRHEAAEGDVRNGDRLLRQAVEEHPSILRAAAVESEGELVQVVFQLLPGDPSLMDAKEPPLEEGDHAMHPGKQGGGSLPAGADHPGPMDIPGLFEARVEFPAVRDDHSSRGHGTLHEPEQTVFGGVRDPLETDSPDRPAPNLGSDSHKCFALPEMPSASTCLDSSDDRFIDLYLVGQAIPAGPHHGAAQLVQAGPGCLVATQAERALKSQGAHAALLVCDPPHRPEPEPQGNVAAVKDGAGRDGYVGPAGSAMQGPSPGFPGLTVTATGTAEPIRPPQLHQVGPTGLLGAKPLFEFQQRFRVVLSHRLMLRL